MYLDTDTLIVGDIRELFRLLDTHDIAGRQDVYPGMDYDFPDVPAPFVEYNGGLLVFRKSPAVAAFFEDWVAEFKKLVVTSPRFETDQPALRRALYRSSLRHCAVPGEYDFQADMGGFLFWEAKVIHCHDDQEYAARMINRVLGARVYFPKLGTVLTGYTGLRAHLARWIRLNWDFFCFFWSALLGKVKRRK